MSLRSTGGYLILAGSRRCRAEADATGKDEFPATPSFCPDYRGDTKVNYLKKYLVTWVQPQVKRVDEGERM
jgi:hypothetical protein